eukprot:1289117-Pleurochrysis_carterae.AAC.1
MPESETPITTHGLDFQIVRVGFQEVRVDFPKGLDFKEVRVGHKRRASACGRKRQSAENCSACRADPPQEAKKRAGREAMRKSPSCWCDLCVLL